jgi:hypothetical protein
MHALASVLGTSALPCGHVHACALRTQQLSDTTTTTTTTTRRGNCVMLGADALSAENAEATLQQLDAMERSHQGAPPPRRPPAPAASADSYQPDIQVSGTALVPGSTAA